MGFYDETESTFCFFSPLGNSKYVYLHEGPTLDRVPEADIHLFVNLTLTSKQAYFMRWELQEFQYLLKALIADSLDVED